MINSKHVHFYWGGPLLLGPPNAYLWGVRIAPTPPGIDAPANNTTREKEVDTHPFSYIGTQKINPNSYYGIFKTHSVINW